jgi:hypothetical protein
MVEELKIAKEPAAIKKLDTEVKAVEKRIDEELKRLER